jgi:hypothetical protein
VNDYALIIEMPNGDVLHRFVAADSISEAIALAPIEGKVTSVRQV